VAGLGRLYFDSILSRDYPVILGLSLLSAAATLAATLASDVAAAACGSARARRDGAVTARPRRGLRALPAGGRIALGAVVRAVGGRRDLARVLGPRPRDPLGDRCCRPSGAPVRHGRPRPRPARARRRRDADLARDRPRRGGGVPRSGFAVGATAGFFGGAVDLVLSRVIEVVLCFPVLFLLLALAALPAAVAGHGRARDRPDDVAGRRALRAREVLTHPQLDYARAATAAGASTPRSSLRHVLPNALAPLIVSARVRRRLGDPRGGGALLLGVGLPSPPCRGAGSSPRARVHRGGVVARALSPAVALFVTCPPIICSPKGFAPPRRHRGATHERAHRGVPGSFDPLTNGHLDILARARRLADRVIVAILDQDQKTPLFSVDDRMGMIRDIVGGDPSISVASFSDCSWTSRTASARRSSSRPAARLRLRVRAPDGADEPAPRARRRDGLPHGQGGVLLRLEPLVKELARLGGDVTGLRPERGPPAARGPF
jgi:cytidyltransferase-like protein